MGSPATLLLLGAIAGGLAGSYADRRGQHEETRVEPQRRERGHELRVRVRDRKEKAKGKASQGLERAKGSASKVAARDRSSAGPVLYGLFAIALGVLLAMVMPVSRKERELLEPARTRAREPLPSIEDRALEKLDEAHERGSSSKTIGPSIH